VSIVPPVFTINLKRVERQKSTPIEVADGHSNSLDQAAPNSESDPRSDNPGPDFLPAHEGTANAEEPFFLNSS
jgi:hypothetical protein